MDSILVSIKKMLGITEDYTHFDPEIIIYINSAFATLYQLGLENPLGAYTIQDGTTTWSELFTTHPNLDSIRSYVYLSVRLIFDPPATSFAIEAISRQLDELTWRINVGVEGGIV